MWPLYASHLTVNKDFDIIGTTFHKWVHDESRRIGLKYSIDFRDFVMYDFKYFSEHYMRMRHAAQKLTSGLEYVFYNAHNNFTLQYPLLLAPLRVEDNLETANCKIRLVAGYLDIFIIRRAVNFRTLDYSSIVYTMFNLVKEIRGLDVPSLVEVLKARVATMEESFGGMSQFYLNMWSKRYIHHILARMTYYIEEQSKVASSFEKYTSRETRNSFEIEHIWANKYGRHSDEFATEEEFALYRNRIGGLVLLPRDINESLGAAAYQKKVKGYLKQNLLAESLHEECYIHNPSFRDYLKQSGLPFKSYPDVFKKADLDARNRLYQCICEEIWSPERFERELAGSGSIVESLTRV